jgi:DNA-binding ferritin-like protein
MAQRVAQMWHWKVKSFALHLALGELYDKLNEFADELAELYMGKYGTEFHIPLSDPNAFSEQDPLEFILQLHTTLEHLADSFPQDGFLVNKYQELQGDVSRIKYKMENLKRVRFQMAMP